MLIPYIGFILRAAKKEPKKKILTIFMYRFSKLLLFMLLSELVVVLVLKHFGYFIEPILIACNFIIFTLYCLYSTIQNTAARIAFESAVEDIEKL